MSSTGGEEAETCGGRAREAGTEDRADPPGVRPSAGWWFTPRGPDPWLLPVDEDGWDMVPHHPPMRVGAVAAVTAAAAWFLVVWDVIRREPRFPGGTR